MFALTALTVAEARGGSDSQFDVGDSWVNTNRVVSTCQKLTEKMDMPSLCIIINDDKRYKTQTRSARDP